ncbi:MAG: substrate-binding domain-containing protein [Mycobacterium sp.]
MKLQEGPQRRWVKFAGVVAAVTLLAACSSTGGKPEDSGGDGAGGGGSVDTPRVTVAMITHEVPGDSFWDLVRKGAEAAAQKDNIELRYSNDPEAPNQANLVQTAVDSDVAGIAITLAKPEAMEPAVKNAVAKKIPVVAFNSGLDSWQAMGVMEYFGQDEYIAGQEAGKRLASEGATKAICVIQEQGHVGLEGRCAGVKNTFPATEVLNVNGKDMPSVESTITAKLQQDPTVDAVLTLGAPFALTAVQSVQNAGSSAKVSTFDTNAALVDAIGRGDVQWAVDQQPYLQGYLAVDSLWLYLNNGNVIGGNQATLTGPSFIDKSNIEAVAEYAKAGTR